MARYGRRKNSEELQFRPGRRTSVLLDQLNVVSGWELRADYGVIVTGGSGAGKPHAEAEGRVVDQIRLSTQVRGTTVPFFNMLGRHNILLQRILRPRPLAQRPPTDDTTAPDLYSTIWIPASVPGTLADSGDVTAIPTERVRALTLEVQTAQADDLFIEEDADSITFDEGSHYTVTERPILDADMAAPRAAHFFNFEVHEVNSDRIDHRLTLPQMQPGDELVRVFAIAESDAEREDGIITAVGLEINGAEVFEKLPVEIYQSQNTADYDLSEDLAGVVAFDFAEDRSIAPGDLMVVTRDTGHNLICDLSKSTGTTHVYVLTEWIRGRIG